jgi:DNA-3-methyladenine glycosylase I
MAKKEIIRCNWSWKTEEDPMIDYHDTVWGVPVHDDAILFEHFSLAGAQAGLSWKTIYARWDGYRQAFQQFDARRIAKWGEKEIEKLLQFEGIIRNRQKVTSVIKNAKCIVDVQKEFGSFDSFLWKFTDGKPKVNAWKTAKQIPATSKESDAMSKEMKKRGFSFAGSTICYSFMQQVGIVNDHTESCFRQTKLLKMK